MPRAVVNPITVPVGATVAVTETVATATGISVTPASGRIGRLTFVVVNTTATHPVHIKVDKGATYPTGPDVGGRQITMTVPASGTVAFEVESTVSGQATQQVFVTFTLTVGTVYPSVYVLEHTVTG